VKERKRAPVSTTAPTAEQRAARRERLLPLLIDLDDGLVEDVKLRELAGKLGTSPFHFHRLFTRIVGETPKKHVERIRLEKAALLLAVTNDPVLDIGLAVGFKNAETFTRRFKKFVGHTPSSYRRMAKAAQTKRLETVNFFGSSEYTLGRARFERLPAMTLLAMRRVGDYGALHDDYSRASPWSALTDFAAARRIAVQPMRIGIFYDDPTLTPPEQQRADLCVPIERSVSCGGPLRCIEFRGGTYALIEYTGRTGTVIDAFRAVADEIRRSDRYDFGDGPPLEIVHAIDVGGVTGVYRFDAAFPVRRLRKPADESKNRQDGGPRRR
jgi:AraC family transcriptional regulator